MITDRTLVFHPAGDPSRWFTDLRGNLVPVFRVEVPNDDGSPPTVAWVTEKEKKEMFPEPASTFDTAPARKPRGRGAPRRGAVRSAPATAYLLPTEHASIIAIGEGNYSAGVRKLLREYEQRLKDEQTKAWEEDWRSNPTAPTDPLPLIVTEPGQEMLPPPSDPTTEETAMREPSRARTTIGRRYALES